MVSIKLYLAFMVITIVFINTQYNTNIHGNYHCIYKYTQYNTNYT